MTEANAAGGPADGISPGAAIAGLVTQPGRTFERLVKSPTWWLPLLISVAAVLAFTHVSSQKVDVERAMRDSMSKFNLSEEQLQKAIERQQSQSPVVRHAMTAAFLLVMFFVGGLIYWGAAKAMGSEARYTQLLAINAHSGLPAAVGALFAIVLFMGVEDGSLLPRAANLFYVKSNLGAFLPESFPTFVVGLASGLDVFGIAGLILTIVGLSKLPGFNKEYAMGVGITLYVLTILVKAAWLSFIL